MGIATVQHPDIQPRFLGSFFRAAPMHAPGSGRMFRFPIYAGLGYVGCLAFAYGFWAFLKPDIRYNDVNDWGESKKNFGRRHFLLFDEDVNFPMIEELDRLETLMANAEGK